MKYDLRTVVLFFPGSAKFSREAKKKEVGLPDRRLKKYNKLQLEHIKVNE